MVTASMSRGVPVRAEGGGCRPVGGVVTLAQPMLVRAPHAAGPAVSVLFSVVPGRRRLAPSRPRPAPPYTLTPAPSHPLATTC